MTRLVPFCRALFLTSILATLSACNKGGGGAPAPSVAASAPAGAASTPPVGVTTVTAAQRDLAIELTATGTVAPLSSVDMRPQLTSVVSRVHIREGQFVKAGELLFTLDSRTDEAKVAQAQAQVARDQAALADAQRQLTRSRELLAQNFISQGAVDANQAQVDAQTALVASDRAALAAARVALGYARVTAPSAGRVGTISVYPGSAVQANTTTLVTITQLDPIAVAFSLPQRHLADALAALPGGGARVSATLPEGAGKLEGRLKFVDNLVDPASGTVKVKAVFDNGAGKLWPGAFVNIAMTARTLKDAVIVPQAAIIQSARGSIVYTVQGGKAEAKPVQLVHAEGEDAAVTGVRAGDKIVLDGRQNLRPGAAVTERPREGAAAASGAASAPSKKASAP
ncbi:MAG TPA: efflux RND transporter periplasmic adaptor subunit [Ideonella sp.]|uniref:efflux RND transporter periplasmic adaptor subunit n=1 Tax=Ideonella sp. TaxID=1929293 RepID=UPI002E34F17D|nr:efflux RND transporter periplasmic adaptor subunit [Ideonella sp.]HEX5683104.1 efflux RND transporter periplasmic adaptor subunit [Ideonella sp.]